MSWRICRKIVEKRGRVEKVEKDRECGERRKMRKWKFFPEQQPPDYTYALCVCLFLLHNFFCKRWGKFLVLNDWLELSRLYSKINKKKNI